MTAQGRALPVGWQKRVRTGEYRSLQMSECHWVHTVNMTINWQLLSLSYSY